MTTQITAAKETINIAELHSETITSGSSEIEADVTV